MLRGEQEEENEGVPSGDLQELDFSFTDDEEVDEGEQGSTALIHACAENMREVRAHMVHVWKLRSLFL